jgi:hypothetical protein
MEMRDFINPFLKQSHHPAAKILLLLFTSTLRHLLLFRLSPTAPLLRIVSPVPFHPL